MDEIIKISRNHFLGSLVLVVCLVSGISIYHFTRQPDLFIPPAESQREKLEDVINKSENIEALRSACSVFAKCRDDAATYREQFVDHLNLLLFQIFGLLVLVFCGFAYGYFAIYRKAKKLKDEFENAL